MFPKIFCLNGAYSSPVIFKSIDDVGGKDRSECSYSCQLKAPKEGSFDQILLFTYGKWPIDADSRVDIYLNDHITKLCSLTKSARCFLWIKDECEDTYDELLTKGNKLILHAKVQGGFFTKGSQEFSSPVLTSLSEGEIMQKHNETTPEVSALPVQILHKKEESCLDVNASPHLSQSGGQTKIKDIAKKTPNEKTSASKAKKRQLDKENSSSTTPKLKTARCRVGSRTTPLAKRCIAAKEPAKDSASSDSQSKMVRCVPLSSRVPKPSSRWGHSMCMVDDKKAILIGGQGNKMQLSKDSVWALDTVCRSWKDVEVKTEGIKPECRTGHSATYDPTMRCIYVFGGSKKSKWFHDVHMYDLDEQKWSLVKANGKAPTRAYHSTTLYRHELWIFGGVFPRPDPQPDGCDNELHIFSPVMEGWYKPIVTGEKPIPRSGHSANLVEDRLVVFGGWDFPFCYNDVHILDLTTVDWSKPVINGQPPKPRCWSASTTLTNSRVFIQGGYDGDNPLADAFIFDLDSYSWQQLEMDHAPSARAGHACLRLCSSYEDREEDEILVFGGGDNDDNFFNDMISFYVPYTPAITE